MLNVGDAVLTFLGDTSQLDQVFARVPAQAAESMGAAAGSVGQLGTAFEGVNFELDATASNVPYCGETIKTAMNEAGGSTRMAAGEVTLLGELFGIHLPRHVRSFVGELPGVGAALQAAFAATAVIFLVEALVKGIEKIQEWSEHSHQLQLAWDGFNTAILTSMTSLDDKLLEAGAHLDDLRGNHLAALQKELELINHATLRDLMSEFDLLAKASDAMFAKLTASWYEFDAGSKGAKNALTDFKAQYDLLLAAGKEKEASDLLAGTLKSAQAALKTMQDQNAEQQKFAHAQMEAAAAAGEFAAGLQVAELHGKDELKSQEALILALTAQVKAEGTINELKKERSEGKTEAEGLRILAEQERMLKAQEQAVQKELNEEEKLRTEARNRAIADLQEQEKEKIEAVKAGSQARIAAIDNAIKEEESKGLQDTGFYKSLQVDRVKAVQAAIDAEQKAVTEAETEQLKRASATAKLELAQIANTYHEREEAVKQLASMQLISEQQKDRQLLSLYQEEETKTLAVLRDQMKQEKEIVDEAQKRASAAGDNPLFSEAQVAALKKNLAAAEIAYEKTQTEITKSEEKFDKERMAIQKGAVGQAIALATAAGNQKLALDLKQHQSALIAIQDQIALAKSRGQDVSAMKEQEKEIANQTKALVAQATQIGKLKQAWDIFSNDFAKSAKTNETTAQQMAQSFTTAAQGMEGAINAAFAAMVSGTESAGQAMEKAVFATIGKIAEQWGAYYIARGIADAFDDPPAAAAEFAAGAALEALGGVMSGLSSLAGSTKSSGTAASTSASTQNAASTAGGPATAPVNIPRLFSGAIVTQPTVAMIGDRQGGGSQTEGVFPLGDPRAKQALMDAFGLGGGGTTHNWNVQGMISTTDLVKLSRTITRGTQTGRLRVSVSNSGRVTRRV